MIVIGPEKARQPGFARVIVEGIARHRMAVAGDWQHARRILLAVAVDHEPRHAPQDRRIDRAVRDEQRRDLRSEEHTSELQSLMRISYAVFCLKKKKEKTKLKDTLNQP